MYDRRTSQRCFFKCDRKAHRFPFQSSRIRTISTSTRGYPNKLPSLPTRVDADDFRKPTLKNTKDFSQKEKHINIVDEDKMGYKAKQEITT